MGWLLERAQLWTLIAQISLKNTTWCDGMHGCSLLRSDSPAADQDSDSPPARTAYVQVGRDGVLFSTAQTFSAVQEGDSVSLALGPAAVHALQHASPVHSICAPRPCLAPPHTRCRLPFAPQHEAKEQWNDGTDVHGI